MKSSSDLKFTYSSCYSSVNVTWRCTEIRILALPRRMLVRVVL